MKIKISKVFYDKYNNSKAFSVGEIVDFETKRAEDVISRGLAIPLEETPSEETEVEAEETPSEETEVEAEETPSEEKPKRRGKSQA